MRSTLLIAIVLFHFSAYAQPDDRASLAAANQNIAASMQKGDLKAAVRHAEKAVEISRQIFGDQSRETAIAYENLGVVLTRGSKHKQAVEPLKLALEIFKKDSDRNGRDILGTMEKLGKALSRSGQEKEAETIFASAADTAKQTFGEKSIQFINAKVASACIHLYSGKDAQAYDEFVESYALALNNFGRDGDELDHVAAACDGTFITDFWKNTGKSNKAREKLNSLLGYELGRPARVQSADFDVAWKDIGRTDIQVSWVVVKVWIDEAGKPIDAKLVFGLKHFSELATSAARQSKFKPSVQNGKPIPDVMYIYYSFMR